MKRPLKEHLKLYYFNACPNAGDILNRELPKRVFGIQVKKQRILDADLVAVGSVLDHFLMKGHASDKQVSAAPEDNPIDVWGTGLMYEGVGPQSRFMRSFRIHALRGEITRRDMSSALGKEIRCPLADPGLLASLLVPKQEKKYDVGIIPHFKDAQEECFQKMKQYYPNSILINIQDSPIGVIKTIGQCRTILSTSLHGLIFADSFGIPNLWCECSDHVPGKGYKFRDYYSAYGLGAESCDLNKGEFPALQEIRRRYAVPYRAVCRKQYELLRSFPYASAPTARIWRKYVKIICRSLFGYII